MKRLLLLICLLICVSGCNSVQSALPSITDPQIKINNQTLILPTRVRDISHKIKLNDNQQFIDPQTFKTINVNDDPNLILTIFNDSNQLSSLQDCKVIQLNINNESRNLKLPQDIHFNTSSLQMIKDVYGLQGVMNDEQHILTYTNETNELRFIGNAGNMLVGIVYEAK